MLDVICLGEPLVGFYGASRHELKDEMQFVRTFGGDTSNVALALAKLGLRVGYVTRVGADPFGMRFLELWRQHGIDTSQIVTDPTAPTGIYFSAASDTRHAFIYYRRGSAASRMTAHDINEAYVAQARVLHVSGISQAISDSCAEAVELALQYARKHGVLVSYDVNHRPTLWSNERAREIVSATVQRHVDILEATREELALITSTDDYRVAADTLLRAGVKQVAVKLGAEGCYLATTGGAAVAPAFPVIVADTVGAGDAFDAGIIAAWLETMPPREAARFACAVAALTCRGVGPVSSQPTREEVNHLLADGGAPVGR